MLHHILFAVSQTNYPLGTRLQEEPYNTLIVGQKLVGNPGRGNWVFLSPLLFVFLVSPFLPLPWPSALRNPTPLYPTHLTPQNLTFGRICISTRLQGQVLVPGFCISILRSLGWDSLRTHGRNGCTGMLQLWVRRSR